MQTFNAGFPTIKIRFYLIFQTSEICKKIVWFQLILTLYRGKPWNRVGYLRSLKQIKLSL